MIAASENIFSDLLSGKAVSELLNGKKTSPQMRFIDWDDPTKHTIHNGSETYGYYKYLPRYQAIYTGDAYKAYAKVVADYLEQYREEHGEALLHDSGSLQGEPVTARTY